LPPPKGYLDPAMWARVRRFRYRYQDFWVCIDVGWTLVSNKIPLAEQVGRDAQNTRLRLTSSSARVQSEAGVSKDAIHPASCRTPHARCEEMLWK
jgi:hypothetical protein